MNIDWGSLGMVALVSFAAAVAVVVLVALAIVGLSAREHAQLDSGTPGVLSANTGTAVAGICLLATVVIVGFGLYVIIS